MRCEKWPVLSRVPHPLRAWSGFVLGLAMTQ
jgi:hypothetical protein